MFRGLLSSEIVAQNATPMFALSSCISIASMSRQCATAAIQPEPQFVDIDQVCEMFLLTRGVADVVSACHESISKGPLAAMMTGYLLPADEDPLALPTTVTQRLEDLYHLAEKACPEEDKFDACKHALLQLDKTYQAIAYYDARNELQTGMSFLARYDSNNQLMRRARACMELDDFHTVSIRSDDPSERTSSTDHSGGLRGSVNVHRVCLVHAEVGFILLARHQHDTQGRGSWRLARMAEKTCAVEHGM